MLMGEIMVDENINEEEKSKEEQLKELKVKAFDIRDKIDFGNMQIQQLQRTYDGLILKMQGLQIEINEKQQKTLAEKLEQRQEKKAEIPKQSEDETKKPEAVKPTIPKDPIPKEV